MSNLLYLFDFISGWLLPDRCLLPKCVPWYGLRALFGWIPTQQRAKNPPAPL